MLPLQKLLGKDDRFFDLIEASAEQARRSVQALHQFLRNPAEPTALEGLVESRRRDKAITTEILDALCTDFVTALEPHDIEALANSLYKIPKTVEKVAERILLAPQHLQGLDLAPQLTLLEQATQTLLQMVKEMRAGITKARVATLNAQLQCVEGDADKAVLEQLRQLYCVREHPGLVLFQKDIFELLEKVTDRCRDAGNVISHIVLRST